MGLQALLGEAARPAPASGEASDRGGVREIDIARIKPNPGQPRVQFDEAALDELADSIRERGVLQPILLRPDGEEYLIVAGERRWRAARRAAIHPSRWGSLTRRIAACSSSSRKFPPTSSWRYFFCPPWVRQALSF